MGATGEAWLAALPDLLAGLSADWSITVGARLDGGRTSYVAEAITHDGTPAVLKVSIPPRIDESTPFGRQLTALQHAGGDPYVGLIRHHAPRQALLLERLGPPMAALGWPAARQLDALARTAARGWRPAPSHGGLPTWAEAARWHRAFIPSMWEDLARPCSEAAMNLAVRSAAARETACDPARAVLVHGDVHAFNTLHKPGPARAGVAFRLVDPGGLISEPAHDLGVIQARGVQGWLGELAASDPRQALEKMTASCRRASRATGADPEAIWQWAYTEIVSTGLHVLRLGDHEEAETFLAVADNLAAATAKAATATAAATAKAKPGRLQQGAPVTPLAVAADAAATAMATVTPAGTADRARQGGGGPATPRVTGEGWPSRRRSPAPDPGPAGPARLLLMVGLPGAGKTTRAKELAAAHRALRLTPDEWMVSLFGEPTADGKRDVLEGRLITVALHALRLGTSVVLDFGLWSRDERSALRWLATSAGASCQVIYLPVDQDVQRARIAHREATAPHTTFPMTEADLDIWRTQFQPPDAAELRDGETTPEPPPGWPGWTQWAADRWPSLDPACP